MAMAVSSEMIAGEGIEYAGAEEGGAHQQVDEIEHDDGPFDGDAPADG